MCRTLPSGVANEKSLYVIFPQTTPYVYAMPREADLLRFGGLKGDDLLRKEKSGNWLFKQNPSKAHQLTTIHYQFYIPWISQIASADHRRHSCLDSKNGLSSLAVYNIKIRSNA